jgi:hypothetical protein
VWDWRRALSPTGNPGDAVFRGALFCDPIVARTTEEMLRDGEEIKPPFAIDH